MRCGSISNNYEATGIRVFVSSDDSVVDGRAVVAWLEENRDLRLLSESETAIGGEWINLAVDGRDFAVISGRPGEVLRVLGGTDCYRPK